MPREVIIVLFLYGIMLGVGLLQFGFLAYEILSNSEARLLLQEQSEEAFNYLTTASLILVAIPICFQAFVFLGFLTGTRLAWYYYRTLGFIINLLSTIVFLYTLFLKVFVAVNENPSSLVSIDFLNETVIDLIYLTIYWLIHFLLGTESARTFFGTICTRCRAKAISMIGFFGGMAKCKKCGMEWS